MRDVPSTGRVTITEVGTNLVPALTLLLTPTAASYFFAQMGSGVVRGGFQIRFQKSSANDMAAVARRSGNQSSCWGGSGQGCRGCRGLFKVQTVPQQNRRASKRPGDRQPNRTGLPKPGHQAGLVAQASSRLVREQVSNEGRLLMVVLQLDGRGFKRPVAPATTTMRRAN